jgi:hypothetical protein
MDSSDFQTLCLYFSEFMAAPWFQPKGLCVSVVAFRAVYLA